MSTATSVLGTSAMGASGVLGVAAIRAALSASDNLQGGTVGLGGLENIFCVTHLFSKVARGRIALSECGGGNRNDA